jgi:hypothetical protein
MLATRGCNAGDKTSATTATTATTLAKWWRRCQRNEGVDTSGRRHAMRCRLNRGFGAGVFVRLDRFEYILVSLSKVMVPISEVNVTHWFFSLWGQLPVLFKLVRF